MKTKEQAQTALKSMAGGGWQPIETAPRILGEPVFLLIDGFSVMPWAVSSRWCKYPQGENWELSVKTVNVTHWLPRPPNPQPPKGQGDE